MTGTATPPTPQAWRAAKRRTTVDGLEMAWWEAGEGAPIVLLHGNVSSSWLWREVVPELTTLGRCIAPDLVGHGDSAKSPYPDDYRFHVQAARLEALLDVLGVREDVTLVVHDWGSALGFDWARRHASALRGIAYMEAIVRPVSWSERPAADLFRALRGEEGEELVLHRNLLVEAVPQVVLRPMPEPELDEWRRPFGTPQDRLPLLTWVRELPIEDEPPDVVETVAAYASWLASTPVPKLLVVADPGDVLVGGPLEFARGFPSQAETTVPGSHFLQEDSGPAIGRAVAEWLGALD